MCGERMGGPAHPEAETVLFEMDVRTVRLGDVRAGAVAVQEKGFLIFQVDQGAPRFGCGEKASNSFEGRRSESFLIE